METPDVFCAYSRLQPADVITHIRHILFILWAKKGLNKLETTNGVYLRVTVLYGTESRVQSPEFCTLLTVNAYATVVSVINIV